MQQVHEAEKKVRELLDVTWQNYVNEVTTVVNAIFEEHVKPFCIKRGWHFRATDRSWSIGPKEHMVSGFSIEDEYPDDEELVQLVGMLMCIQVPGFPMNTLGSMMPAYRGEDERQDK